MSQRIIAEYMSLRDASAGLRDADGGLCDKRENFSSKNNKKRPPPPRSKTLM